MISKKFSIDFGDYMKPQSNAFYLEQIELTMSLLFENNMARFRRYEKKTDYSTIIPLNEIPTFALLISSMNSMYSYFIRDCYAELVKARKENNQSLDDCEEAFSDLLECPLFSEKEDTLCYKNKPIDENTMFFSYNSDETEEYVFALLESVFKWFEPYCFVVMYLKQYFMQDRIEKYLSARLQSHYSITDIILKDMQDSNFDWTWYDSPILYRSLNSDCPTWWSEEHREVDELERFSVKKDKYEQSLILLLEKDQRQDEKERIKNLQKHQTDIKYFIIAEKLFKSKKYCFYPRMIYSILTADFLQLDKKQVNDILQETYHKMFAQICKNRIELLVKKKGISIYEKGKGKPALDKISGIPEKRLESAIACGLKTLSEEQITSIATILDTTVEYLTQP